LEGKKPTQKKSTLEQLGSDLLIGGTIGAISKTIMAPVERVKILKQTQKSNPAVLSGEVKPYTSIRDCFSRVYSEQGIAAFWRGNLVNCIRYAPQQGSALAFNDYLNNLFPVYNSNTDFWKSFGTKLTSGGLAGAVANTICYPFDFARTRLASDLQTGKPQFKGITDCIVTTVKNQGIVGLYNGWIVTCMVNPTLLSVILCGLILCQHVKPIKCCGRTWLKDSMSAYPKKLTCLRQND